jgi:pre-mRNA-splicing factor ATP-dependent RNA helicase DHX16
MFPVDIYCTKSPEADYVNSSVVTVLQIHASQPLNIDVVVFLLGKKKSKPLQKFCHSARKILDLESLSL